MNTQVPPLPLQPCGIADTRTGRFLTENFRLLRVEAPNLPQPRIVLKKLYTAGAYPAEYYTAATIKQIHP